MAELDDKTNTTAPPSEPTADPQPEPDVRRKRARREPLSQDDVTHSAVARANPDRSGRALELSRVCARIADDNRANDVLLLDLRKATSLVDYFLIATATSRRQSHAIAEEIDQEMKRRGEAKLGMEGSEEGRWVLVDYGDLVVHVFSAEARDYYRLEEIWGDADHLDWQAPDTSRPAPPSD